MSYPAGFKNLKPNQDYPHPRPKLFGAIPRRKTEPVANMARDSRPTARRSSTAISQTSASTSAIRSRFSAVGGPVQPLTPAYSKAYSREAGGTGNASEANWSNVTGFRSCLDVAGSPQADYFTSGLSKLDRRAEYIGRPLTGSVVSPTQPIESFQPVRSPMVGGEFVDDYDEESGDDDATLLPSDSVSQIGRGRSRSKPKGRGLFGEIGGGGGGGDGAARRMPPAGMRRSHTHSNVNTGGLPDWTAQNVVGGGGTGGRRYSVVERKPKGF